MLGDAAVVASAVAIAAAPHVPRLGFYSDDWLFVARMRFDSDGSIASVVRTLWELGPNLQMRPTQILQQAALFRLFGTEPLGYHVFSAAVLASIGVLVILVARNIGASRTTGLAVAAIAVTLPTFTGARFWFAAFGYTVSVAFALAAVWLNLRGLQHRGPRSLLWKTAGLTALVAAGLGYEIVLPPLLLASFGIWYGARRGIGPTTPFTRHQVGWYVAVDVVLIAAIVVYKSQTASDIGDTGSEYLLHLIDLSTGAVAVHAGTFGAWLPVLARRAIADAWLPGIVAATAAALVIGWRVWRIARGEGVPVRTLRLALIGLTVLASGYAIFLVSGRISVTSTGIGSRAHVVGAIGMAIVLVAVAAAVARSAPSRTRGLAFAGLVALLAFAGSTVSAHLADRWVDAWHEQLAIIAAVEAAVPAPRSDTTLLLHGVCPHEGPAVVFESNWGVTGALQLAYDDPTLQGDVVTERSRIADTAIRIWVYGPETSAVHHYGPDLLLVDPRDGSVVPLTDRGTALRHIGPRGDRLPARCPPAAPGRGVILAGPDRLQRLLVARVRDRLGAE